MNLRSLWALILSCLIIWTYFMTFLPYGIILWWGLGISQSSPLLSRELLPDSPVKMIPPPSRSYCFFIFLVILISIQITYLFTCLLSLSIEGNLHKGRSLSVLHITIFLASYSTWFMGRPPWMFIGWWIDGWRDGWMNGWVYGWVGEQMIGWMDGWRMVGWVNGWMGRWMHGWVDG